MKVRAAYVPVDWTAPGRAHPDDSERLRSGPCSCTQTGGTLGKGLKP